MAQMSARLKAKRRLRRRRHVRHHVFGLPERPRMSVYRSLAHIYVQLIDDTQGRTLCSASTMDKELKGGLKGTGNREAAEAVGAKIAERAKAAGVQRVVFDRNGFRYHGRVQALADAARKAGLEF